MRLREKLKKIIRRVPWRRAAMGLAALAVTGGLVVAFTGGTARVAADDCDPNDVMPCGASGAPEFVNKITGELGTVYAHFGLSSDDYDDFKDKAVMGMAKKDGTVVDDKGNVVMTNAWSIGRTHFGFAEPYEPLSSVGEFFKSAHATTQILADDLPVLILFDKEGTVKFAVITSCGNPIQAEKVKSGAKCKDLIKEPVEDKKNTFRFTTDAHKFGFAEFLKFEYFFDDGDGKQPIGTTESADEPVEKTFEKDAKVWVEITISLPGGHEKVVVDEACEKEIKVEKEKKEEKKEEVKVLSVTKVTPAAKLPVTGPAGLAGLFAGVSAAGALGHHLYTTRRKR